jgi:hypothetical protein
MTRIGEDLLAITLFHHPPEVHDDHSVTQVADDTEVVRDEDHGEPQAVTQVMKELEDGRLHGHVERRNGLIGDDHLGFDDQGAGDGDALALAPGELPGFAVQSPYRETDHAHKFPASGLLVRARDETMDLQELAQDLADR